MMVFEQFNGEVPIPDNKLSSLFNFIGEQLKDEYSLQELNHIRWLLIEHFAEITAVDFRKKPDQLVNHSVLLSINGAIQLLKKQVPIQYITGKQFFYENTFFVNEHTLIPRPETEELVDYIVKAYKSSSPCILDIGSGSGCIALSVKKGILKATVYALEVSEKALDVARKNEESLKVKINWMQADVFTDKWLNNLNELDVIVSNPPYVLNAEMNSMEKRVVSYEPHLALFVNDDDPLVYYQRIAEIGKKILKFSGKIFLEINEKYGEETARLFLEYGYKNAIIKNDLSGKSRFVIVTK
jgi:release factor glutamine methyltransferase